VINTVRDRIVNRDDRVIVSEIRYDTIYDTIEEINVDSKA